MCGIAGFWGLCGQCHVSQITVLYQVCSIKAVGATGYTAGPLPAAAMQYSSCAFSACVAVSQWRCWAAYGVEAVTTCQALYICQKQAAWAAGGIACMLILDFQACLEQEVVNAAAGVVHSSAVLWQQVATGAACFDAVLRAARLCATCSI